MDYGLALKSDNGKLLFQRSTPFEHGACTEERLLPLDHDATAEHVVPATSQPSFLADVHEVDCSVQRRSGRALILDFRTSVPLKPYSIER